MSFTSEIWGVVPVKEPGEAKQRLARAYPPELRRRLAIAMLEDVLSALAASKTLAGLVLVTVDRAAAALGRRYGAAIFEDGARDGHTGAVMAAARRLHREGRRGMLTVPGDVPLATSAEIDTLVAGHPTGSGFSIVPAHDGRGSNAIVMTPPDAVPLAFGNDSFLPHLDAASRAGLPPRILRLPGIALDIDNPEDLALFMRAASPTRTWALLAEAGLVDKFAEPLAKPVAPELLRS
jgi:2-phospho-L-lactate guanylyltransferase